MFTQEVQNVVIKEGDSGEFWCELSKPGDPVDWRRGRVILKSGDKYEMKQEGRITKLLIHNVEERDAGKYTCKSRDAKSTAELTVMGESDQTYECTLRDFYFNVWSVNMARFLINHDFLMIKYKFLHTFVVKYIQGNLQSNVINKRG